MAQSGKRRGARRGGLPGTALGLAALGVAAALAGAFLIGPMLQTKTGLPDAPRRRAANPAPGVTEDGSDRTTRETTVAATHEPDEPEHEAEVAGAAGRRERQPEVAAAPGTDGGPEARRPTAATGPRGIPGEPGRRPAVEIVETRRRLAGGPGEAAAGSQPGAGETTAEHRRAGRPDVVGLAGGTGTAAGERASEDSTAAEGQLFRVRAGRYSSQEEAEAIRARLAASGLPATVVRRNRDFSVQAGSYRIRENAERAAELLRQQQLQPEISER
jgi:cell division protein FtsN